MTAPLEYASIRYLVDDVSEAIDFYTSHLGFTLHTNPAPAFADVIPTVFLAAVPVAVVTVLVAWRLQDRPLREHTAYALAPVGTET